MSTPGPEVRPKLSVPDFGLAITSDFDWSVTSTLDDDFIIIVFAFPIRDRVSGNSYAGLPEPRAKFV